MKRDPNLDVLGTTPKCAVDTLLELHPFHFKKNLGPFLAKVVLLEPFCGGEKEGGDPGTLHNQMNLDGFGFKSMFKKKFKAAGFDLPIRRLSHWIQPIH